jgi:hypothetical protein
VSSTNVNDIAAGYLTNLATSSLGLPSTNVSASVAGMDFNVARGGISVNTPFGNFKLDPSSVSSTNVNDIAAGYLTKFVTSSLGLPSTNVSASVAEMDFNVALDGIGINTPLGNLKLDPKSSYSENVASTVQGCLGEAVTQQIDQFRSDFNEAACMQTEGSLYSDGTTSLLLCQANAGVTIGTDGVKANARADGCLSKHQLGDTNINVGEGQVYANASLGYDGMKLAMGGELNVVSVKNENVQACIGLNAKTGVGLSTTNVSATIVGLGFSAGVDGVGVSTPLASINLKLW